MKHSPLWFIDESDAALQCNTQYLFGDEIMVAPIITPGTSRDVYIPVGKWQYQNGDKHEYDGPNKITLNVGMSELAYFKRVL
jgi:alpha-glucosidase (family GH31 glycosyl hydrolase)